ncbi:MAG: radical SAM protein, partial [Desulfobacterales bacterium]|nr:radical SAM protein [Desulfobacterales bacterium]
MAPPLVIPIFIPHVGCPHQCAFCNQATLTDTRGHGLPSPRDIQGEIQTFLQYQGRRNRVELAFYGGNFLGLSPDQIRSLLESARPFIQSGKIHGIRFSTRPDTIHPHTLDLIRDYPICLIELGIQSMDDTVLETARRGHTAKESRRAMDLIRKENIPLGVQVMVGLPGDSRERMIQTARALVQYQPETARIYPLLVLSGSPLALSFKNKEYAPLGLDEAVSITKALYQIFTRAGTRVIRMGLQASDLMEDEFKVKAGPWHPAFGHLVFSALALDEIQEQIKTLSPNPGDTMDICFHPAMESRIRGDKNQNLTTLSTRFP